MPNWGQVLQQISDISQKHQVEAAKHQRLAELPMAIAAVRNFYLAKLNQQTGRNVIAYYSGFLSKPGAPHTSIGDEDKNGFMMAVHRMGRKRMAGLDLILHTPGGDIASTQSIIRYLREMFDDDNRAIVPQIAMSAGSIIACCCREVWLGKHSNLGPFDPQVNGIPASRISEEFKRAIKEIKKDPAMIAVWRPIIEKYSPTLLDICEDAIKWSGMFVEKELRRVMFAKRDLTGNKLPMTRAEEADARRKARKIAMALGTHTASKTHNQHIHFAELKALGVNVRALEEKGTEDFQDTVLTIHHCYMHTLMNTPAVKIIENHLGDAMVKLINPSNSLSPHPIAEQPPSSQ